MCEKCFFIKKFELIYIPIGYFSNIPLVGVYSGWGGWGSREGSIATPVG